eukprot:3588589-Rhodomonas_salina.7
MLQRARIPAHTQSSLRVIQRGCRDRGVCFAALFPIRSVKIRRIRLVPQLGSDMSSLLRVNIKEQYHRDSGSNLEPCDLLPSSDAPNLGT